MLLNLSAQTAQLRSVELEKAVQDGRLMINSPGTWQKVYPGNFIVPDSFSNTRYLHEIIDYAQVVYQSCRNLNDGVWNNDRLEHMINRWGIDTTYCSPQVLNSFINGAVSLGPDSSLYYAIDQNNNLSFLDEEFHLVDDTIARTHKVVFERFENNSIIVDSAVIHINKIRTTRAGEFNGFEFDYYSYKKGTLIVDADTLGISCIPGGYYTYDQAPSITITSPDGGTSSLTINQYWQYDSIYYQITKVSKSGLEITFEEIPNTRTLYTNQIGFQAPPIYDQDRDYLRDTEHEFTYIYFWNIDCAPCLSQLPGMQRSYDEMSERDSIDFKVLLVSIDKPIQTRQFLEDKGIKFKNIEIFGNSQLFDDYHIEYFPTKYIVDRRGIITHTPENRMGIQSFWALRE